MRTDPRLLHGRRFDVLIVGGGIHGLAMAREAALRGASTLLVEREDYACGTSMRSSRLMHGGVRYLQQGHLALVREASQERERLFRQAPHLVRPLPMLMPFFSDGPGSALLTRLGLWLYGRMATRSTLPRPRALTADRCVRLFPGLREQGLRSGVLFYDGVTEDMRLALAVAEAAAADGAMLCNHTEVTGTAGEAILLQDHVSDAQIMVQAGVVLNCAGPGADQVRRRFRLGGPDLVRTSRGSHLVLPQRPGDTALCAFLPDRRIQFVIPHRDGTLCGTTDVDEADDEMGPTVPIEDMEYLLGALSWLLQDPPSVSEVRFAYAGRRSLPVQKGPTGGLNREAFTVQETSTVGPIHTVVGGKWTTHRSFAERVVARLLHSPGPSPSRERKLPGGDGVHDVDDPLWWRHGSRAGVIRGLMAAEPDLASPICPHRELLQAEAAYAMGHLGVVTFTDLALRRLFHSQGPCPMPACRRALYGLYQRFQGPAAEPEDIALTSLDRAIRHMAGAALHIHDSADTNPRPDKHR